MITWNWSHRARLKLKLNSDKLSKLCRRTGKRPTHTAPSTGLLDFDVWPASGPYNSHVPQIPLSELNYRILITGTLLLELSFLKSLSNMIINTYVSNKKCLRSNWDIWIGAHFVKLLRSLLNFRGKKCENTTISII